MLVEVSPRDGLQNETVLVSADDKVSLIQKAAAAGARRIEVTSFVSPRAVPQLADAEIVMERIANQTDLQERGVSLSGLVLNGRGLDRALKAGVDEVNLVVLASSAFNLRNQGAEPEETMRAFEKAARTAKAEGRFVCLTIGAAWGCPFEGDVAQQDVLRLAEQGAAFGVDEISFADTIGVGDPVSVDALVTSARAALPGMPLRCHFHDTRNTGLANAFAAWKAGVVAFDASIGGIGGCPFAPAATGNIATEDLDYMFGRMGVPLGLDMDRLRDTARWLEADVLRKPVPSALLRAGGFPRGDRAMAVCRDNPASDDQRTRQLETFGQDQ